MTVPTEPGYVPSLEDTGEDHIQIRHGVFSVVSLLCECRPQFERGAPGCEFLVRTNDADEIFESGIEEDVCRETDPEDTAIFLGTVINGSMTGRVTSNHDSTGTVRDQAEASLTSTLTKSNERRV